MLSLILVFCTMFIHTGIGTDTDQDTDREDTMQNESPMKKKCRDCGQIGHTKTSCRNGRVGSFKLFGVMIDPTAEQSEDDDCLQHVNGVGTLLYKSKSMDCAKRLNSEHSSCSDSGYMSDDHTQDKKKGLPWTEDEHRSFLEGLSKLGRGSWRAISKDYVPSRTPTQVASHAQKYFNRMKSTEEDKRKRRTSLFDIPLNESSTAPETSGRPPVAPTSRTYGVEGSNCFSSMMDYRNRQLPVMNYAFQKNISYPLPLVSQPLPITNHEEKLSIQEEGCSTQDPEEGSSTQDPEVEVESTKDE